MNPRNGTMSTVITLLGDRFTNNSSNVVITLGGYPCIVNTATESSTTFTISPKTVLPVGQLFELEVTIKGKGIAFTNMPSSERYFGLFPEVTTVTPTSGSVGGGTYISIAGSGFSSESGFTNIVVVIGNDVCQTVSVNYTNIVCLTLAVSSTDILTYSVDVYVQTQSGYISVVYQNEHLFTYNLSISPVIYTVSPESLDGTPTDIHIKGNNFGVNSNNVQVTIDEHHCFVSFSNESYISCLLVNIYQGDNDLIIYVKGVGKTVKSSAVQGILTSTTISPQQGSIYGGTRLTITGNGFFADHTSINIGGQPCDIESINISTMVCTSSYNGFEHNQNVNIRVNTNSRSDLVNNLNFEYSLDSTPLITTVLPNNGTVGDVITINGTGFLKQSDTSTVRVSIGRSFCTVINATDTNIQCQLTPHNSGKYSVSVYVNGKGNSNNNVVFTYGFMLSSISPSQGKLQYVYLAVRVRIKIQKILNVQSKNIYFG